MAQTRQIKDDELTRDDIRDALSHIDPNDRLDWFKMAVAVWSELGDDGFDLWDEWSQGGATYEAKAAKQTWRSAGRGHGRVHIGTLIFMAQAAGWKYDPKEREPLSEAAKAQRKADREKRAEEAKRAQKAAEGAAAKLANEIWSKAAPIEGNGHPYLQRKGIHAHGLRVGEWPMFDKETGAIRKWIPGALLIPLVTKAGKITSLQAVFSETPAGWTTDKAYLRDGKKQGAFHMLGTPKPGASIILCEGYATGATIHEATNWCVVVTFDAGNLAPVAEAMSDALPGHAFVVAADNDQWTKSGKIENPGVHWATEAGRVINARVVVPKFKNLDEKPTDFNDLARLEGPAEVTRQLIPALPVAANDAANEPAADSGAVDLALVDRIGLPDQGGKGAVMPTMDNLAEICRRLRVVIRYNEITKVDEILIPGKRYSVDNNARASLQWVKDQAVKFRMPLTGIRENIMMLGEDNHFNPVVTWVTSKAWDGRSRLRELFDTITLADPERNWLRDALIRRWMITAIAAAFTPEGIAAQGMLVLQGPQDVGKTTWFKSLVPPELGLVQDGVTLNPSDRDSVKMAVRFWMNELGELDATFRKADLAQLKSFVTRQRDMFRKPYAEEESDFARRTVFFGSVNPKHYLHDPTGNRRFWTLEVIGVDSRHEHLDMQQVWAEVHALWLGGETHHLSPDEKAGMNEHNESFTAIDPIEELIRSRIMWDSAIPVCDWVWKTATEILHSIGYDKPTPAEATRAATIVRKVNGGEAEGNAKRSNGKSMLRIPPVAKWQSW